MSLAILHELRARLQKEVGAEIDAGIEDNKYIFWFGDLSRRESPQISIARKGLKRHSVELTFGNFSYSVVARIHLARGDNLLLARALLKSITIGNGVSVNPQHDFDSWEPPDKAFTLEFERVNINQPEKEDELLGTIHKIVAPAMAALAELIGYETDQKEILSETPESEGQILQRLIKVRERSPRNRMLCLKIHGEKCAICNKRPKDFYGEAGSILEVHHLEQLSNLEHARSYDPEKDLLPLCPDCHRAVHTRKPFPYSPGEMREIIAKAADE